VCAESKIRAAAQDMLTLLMVTT